MDRPSNRLSRLARAGAFAYTQLSDSSNKQVQLNEDVSGNVDDAVGSFKQLVQDNTR